MTRAMDEMIEIVRHPGGQEVPERHRPQRRVQALAVEVGVREPERPQVPHVVCPKRRELFEQLRQRLPSGLLELREAVERVEGARVGVLEDDLQPAHPVGAFAMNQMAEDVERRPGAGPFVRTHPPVGQTAEHRVKDRRHSFENGKRVRQHQTASSGRHD